MVTIQIDEYVNGFGLKVFDDRPTLHDCLDEQVIINEIIEEKLQVYNRLIEYLSKEAENELKLRGQYASQV